MYRLLPILVYVLLVITSCRNHDGIEIDDEDLMVNVLTDMYIADVALTKHSTSLRDSMRLIYRAQIIEIYDLNIKSYDSLYSLIQSDFDQMDPIQLKVLERLRALNKETESKIK